MYTYGLFIQKFFKQPEEEPIETDYTLNKIKTKCQNDKYYILYCFVSNVLMFLGHAYIRFYEFIN
jgi:hypothetical protein